jgi:hypothetical protein
VLDAKRVTFVWSENPDGEVTEVVATTPEYQIDDGVRFVNSRGVGDLGWMNGDDPRQTPEGLFAELLTTGFADRYWLEEAISQFALLAQCGWAQTMLAALRK